MDQLTKWNKTKNVHLNLTQKETELNRPYNLPYNFIPKNCEAEEFYKVCKQKTMTIAETFDIIDRTRIPYKETITKISNNGLNSQQQTNINFRDCKTLCQFFLKYAFNLPVKVTSTGILNVQILNRSWH